MFGGEGQSRGGSLFERLEQAAAPAGQSMGEVTHVVTSIKRHLVRLLNAHPGNSASVPELGLLDFNDATLGTYDLNIQIRSAIRQCIEKYEPRVKRVDVIALPKGPDPLQLRFQVTVYLKVGSQDDKTTIDLLLDDKRYYRVM
ncbi:MAG TPA: type VI secretion system baseplate subunit TssE [Marinobacter sp.]|nr:type VI secretion system baseplate subunit TssE [Marinobacter sp.]